MHFSEIKELLSGEQLTYTCTLLERSDDRLVLRYDLPHEGHVGDLALPVGTRSFAYYWQRYPYNVYHLIDHEGTTVAFYVNISGPVMIGEDYVHWTDLVVDILIVPDETQGYRVEVLDEEEIPQDVDPATLRHIDDAVAEVMRRWPALVRELSAHSRRLDARLN